MKIISRFLFRFSLERSLSGWFLTGGIFFLVATLKGRSARNGPRRPLRVFYPTTISFPLDPISYFHFPFPSSISQSLNHPITKSPAAEKMLKTTFILPITNHQLPLPILTFIPA
jgi:hypothetical protein